MEASIKVPRHTRQAPQPADAGPASPDHGFTVPAGARLRPSQAPAGASADGVTGAPAGVLAPLPYLAAGPATGSLAAGELAAGTAEQTGRLQRGQPRTAVGGLRPSQVPYPGEPASPANSPSRPARRMQLRPSGAPAGAAPVPARPSAVPARPILDVLKDSGQPLATPLREEMEARLGADLSDVRVHTGATARASAAAVHARAYTAGSHVVIGEKGAGKHTLAHELSHVIQQRQGPVAGTDNGNGLKISHPSDADERAAEASASRAMTMRPPEPNPHSTVGNQVGQRLSRQPSELSQPFPGQHGEAGPRSIIHNPDELNAAVESVIEGEPGIQDLFLPHDAHGNSPRDWAGPVEAYMRDRYDWPNAAPSSHTWGAAPISIQRDYQEDINKGIGDLGRANGYYNQVEGSINRYTGLVSQLGQIIGDATAEDRARAMAGGFRAWSENWYNKTQAYLWEADLAYQSTNLNQNPNTYGILGVDTDQESDLRIVKEQFDISRGSVTSTEHVAVEAKASTSEKYDSLDKLVTNGMQQLKKRETSQPGLTHLQLEVHNDNQANHWPITDAKFRDEFRSNFGDIRPQHWSDRLHERMSTMKNTYGITKQVTVNAYHDGNLYSSTKV